MNLIIVFIYIIILAVIALPEFLLMKHPFYKQTPKLWILAAAAFIANAAHVAVYTDGVLFNQNSDLTVAGFALYCGVAFTAPVFALVFFRRKKPFAIFSVVISAIFILCFTGMLTALIKNGTNRELSTFSTMVFVAAMLLPQFINIIFWQCSTWNKKE